VIPEHRNFTGVLSHGELEALFRALLASENPMYSVQVTCARLLSRRGAYNPDHGWFLRGTIVQPIHRTLEAGTSNDRMHVTVQNAILLWTV